MIIDFLIGLFAANALPHYLIGKYNGRVLCLFGYGARANIAYSLFCVAVSLALFQFKYGLLELAKHGVLLGVLFVLFSFYLGWPIIQRFLTDHSA